ncbi:MAG: hypothetical protein WCP03_03785 [Candidatus Saccharibacteria bacterium]
MKLRIGVLLIVAWWVPIWLFAPFISNYFNNSPTVAVVTTTIIIIQTLIGLFGFFLVGKEISGLIKHNTKKQALKMLWYSLIHGQVKKTL